MFLLFIPEILFAKHVSIDGSIEQRVIGIEEFSYLIDKDVEIPPFQNNKGFRSLFLDAKNSVGKSEVISQTIDRYYQQLGALNLEKARSLSNQGKFTVADANEAILGRIRAPVWYHFKLDYKGSKELSLVLLTTMQIGDTYLIDPNGEITRIRTGSYYPHSQWPRSDIPKRRDRVSIPLNLELTGTYEVFVRNVSLQYTHSVGFQIFKTSNFDNEVKIDYLLFGGFFGVMAGLLIYYLGVYVLSREAQYFYYTFYVLGNMGLFGTYLGPIRVVFLEDHVLWTKDSAYLSVLLMHAFLNLFLMRFLDLKKVSPMFYWVLAIDTIIWLFWFHVPWDSIATMSIVANRLDKVYNCIILGMCCLLIYRKHTQVYFFLVAFGCYIGSFWVAQLNWTKTLGTSIEWMVPIAGMMELLILSMAMGHRLKRLNSSLIKLDRTNRKRMKEVNQLERLNSEIRAKTLHDQMQPHFLFNCLGMITNQVRGVSKEAEDSLHTLSDLYRQILLSSDQFSWKVSEELAVIEDYLKLQKQRFGDRISYQIDCDVDPDSIEVPCMVLQTLVENAVKHGISKHIKGGFIQVSINHKPESGYWVRVVDSGTDRKAKQSKVTPQGTGTGLRNTQQRLRNMYGDQARFLFHQEESMTTVAFWISGEAFDPGSKIQSLETFDVG